MKCKRKVNAVLETIDFVDEVDGSIIFRTCEAERGKVNSLKHVDISVFNFI